MGRKINHHRIYLIIRGIVLVVSALALLLGTYSALVYGSREEEYLDKYQECLNEARDDEKWDKDNLGESFLEEKDYHYEARCQRYFRLITNTQNTAIYGAAIGLGLPILFFGIKWLVEYIAPEEGHKKK